MPDSPALQKDKPPAAIPASTPAMQKWQPLAIAILNNIKSGAMNAIDLNQDQRRLCVRHMMQEGTFTPYDMEHILCVNASTIWRDKKAIRSGNELAALVIDEAELAQEIVETASIAYVKLTKQSKHRDAWTVKKEAIELLQSMGYIKKVEQKLNIRGAISLLEVLNLERTESDADEPDGGSGGNGSNGNGHGPIDPESHRSLASVQDPAT